MSYLENYLDKIISRGNPELAESISITSEYVGENYLKNFSFTSHEIGLLFGNVQSGKTGQMFGIISKATDLGFPVFVILTTDNVALQQQTLLRVKGDLDEYCICGENDSLIFTENNLMLPTIVVLKKNARILKLWANVFNSTGFMRGNPIFIVDDEADAASLNTLINKNLQSSVNKYLESIRNSAASSLYLQVTGTPQSLFLQTHESGWHPFFTYYFKPGKSYLGGDFFFPNTRKPDCVTYLDNLKTPERDVVIRHLLVSAQIFASGGNISTCLVHPSVKQVDHQKFAKSIRVELNWCKENLTGDFISELKKQYELLNPNKSPKVPFSEIMDNVTVLLTKNKIKVLVMNGTTDVESSEYSSGCNFVIGGNTLGRGITFPGLQTIYYTRTSKNPQADTMWQHSRMFGYDRDPGMMMVYIDEKLYKLFADINTTNNAIISQIEHGIDDVKFYYPKGLNPTRKNVLDANYVATIAGGTNYYPFNLKNNTTSQISELLASFDDTEKYYQVSLRLIKELISHIETESDFKLSSFMAIIDAMTSHNPNAQGILIVRRGRDVTQGTGALLSPNDWKLGSSFNQNVVLTMYKVTGDKGWGGKPIWVPNIKLPQGSIYYDVLDE